jgi:uncharacterized metal-binding protein YceD (DUF177 family)
MDINLNTITERGIIVDQDITWDAKYLKKELIKDIKNCHVKGRIYYSETNEILFEGNVQGIMVLKDANTGELLDHPFSCDINEIIGENENIVPILRVNNQNRLDLEEVLWQNIVLEVPIKVSKTKRPQAVKGEGWELRDENSKKEDPRLECFKALLEKGKE